MALDPTENFAFVEVSGSFLVGASTITLVSGSAAKLPVPATDGAFNLTLWNETNFPNPADAGASDVEIVRVTSITGEVLTITRAQESTTAIASTAGKIYRMLLGPTKKMVTDTQTEIDAATNPPPALQVFTASGTYTKPAGLSAIIVELVGGGGAGGDGGTATGGAGGGGGGYSRRRLAAAAVGVTETVTIGAAGGTTSFGSLLSATGGSDGADNGPNADGGVGGVGSDGDVNMKGQGGAGGTNTSHDVPAGMGGSSLLGGGAASRVTDGDGDDGGNYGGGGAGGSNGFGSGGAGAGGVLIVTEFF